jgi:predicted ATPase
MSGSNRHLAQIEYLSVRNYRALHSVEFKDLKSFSVLLGPNGSGKSTVFDVFAFLSECFEFGLRRTWDKRGRAKELKTRGAEGPIIFDLKYREPNFPLITYHLAVDERKGAPVVTEEWLQWKRKTPARPFRFLDYREGRGQVISGELPEAEDKRVDLPLKSSDLLAVNTLGQLAEHPRAAALRDFITAWHVSYFSVDNTRQQPEAGPQERLSRTGDNLANVVQYLSEQHPDTLGHIYSLLRNRIPHLEKVYSEIMQDGHLLLQIKDAPFENPILARFASDGTLKMLAYLVLLNDPMIPPFIGIEEPENFLHPRLLPGLAEECRASSEHGQLLITTHSPFILNSMRPDEVRILYRDEKGYTRVERASEIRGVNEFVNAGASLGELWLEGQFGIGDPLRQERITPPKKSVKKR